MITVKLHYFGIIPVGGISDGGILHGGNPSGRFPNGGKHIIKCNKVLRFPNGGKHIIKCNKVFISVLFVSMFCLPCNVRPAGLPR